MIGLIKGRVVGKFRNKEHFFDVVVFTNTNYEYEGGEKLNGSVLSSNLGFGVGYTCTVGFNLGSQINEGDIAELWTYLHSTDKGMYVFGLKSKEQLRLFLRLIEIPGIGPKTGLKIMDFFTLEELLLIIKEGNIKELSKVSGLAKRGATKILLELSNYADSLVESELKCKEKRSKFKPLKSALMNLGYTQKETDSMVEMAEAELLESLNRGDNVAEQIKIIFNKSRKQ